MTHFDNLLRRAFEAGRKYADDDFLEPDFETWRAGLSGLEVSEPDPIGPGDVVEVLDDEEFAGPVSVVRGRCTFEPETDWQVKHPNHDWPRCFDERRLRKVSDAADG